MKPQTAVQQLQEFLDINIERVHASHHGVQEKLTKVCMNVNDYSGVSQWYVVIEIANPAYTQELAKWEHEMSRKAPAIAKYTTAMTKYKEDMAAYNAANIAWRRQKAQEAMAKLQAELTELEIAAQSDPMDRQTA
jgi:hypothetical protein